MIASFALAAVAMAAGVRHPLPRRPHGRPDPRGRDEPVAAGRRDRRRRAAAARCSASRGGWSPAASRSGVEFDLRNRMYAHLQSLELGFFDSQQTGQLMSRSTVDLQAVRFFLGYGLIFILQSALTILIAAGVMLAVNPALAAVALAPVPFVVVIAARYGRLNRPGQPGGPAADRGADRRGGGERLRACAWSRRSRRRSASSRASARRCSACSTSRWSRRGCARSTTRSSGSCRSSGSPRCSWSAAARRSTARSRSASSSPSTATS